MNRLSTTTIGAALTNLFRRLVTNVKSNWRESLFGVFNQAARLLISNYRYPWTFLISKNWQTPAFNVEICWEGKKKNCGEGGIGRESATSHLTYQTKLESSNNSTSRRFSNSWNSTDSAIRWSSIEHRLKASTPVLLISLSLMSHEEDLRHGTWRSTIT